jgi:hypothetical protein
MKTRWLQMLWNNNAADGVCSEERQQSAGRPPESRRYLGWRYQAAAVLGGGAMAAAIYMLAACGAAGHSADPAVQQGRSASAGSATDTRLAGGQPSGRSAEVLYYFVPATGAQYAIGAQFAGIYSALQNDIISACMAQAGFHVPRTSAAVYASQDFDNSQWPDLDAISRSGMLDPGLLYGIPEVAVPRGEQQTYQADFTRCENAQQATFAPLTEAGNALTSPWLGIVGKIQSSARLRAVLAGFSSCVEREGTPASSAGSFNYFLAWVTGLEATAPTQADAVAVDQHWAPVFVQCAGPTVAIQNRLELAEQVAFFKEHRQEMQDLESVASQVITEIERQYGSAGTGRA